MSTEAQKSSIISSAESYPFSFETHGQSNINDENCASQISMDKNHISKQKRSAKNYIMAMEDSLYNRNDIKQFKEALKKYCLSRFYEKFAQNHVSTMAQLRRLSHNELMNLEKNVVPVQMKLKHQKFQQFIRTFSNDKNYESIFQNQSKNINGTGMNNRNSYYNDNYKYNYNNNNNNNNICQAPSISTSFTETMDSILYD